MESKKNVNVMSDLPSGVTRGPIGQKGPFCGVSFRPEDDVSKICVESNSLEEQVDRLRKLERELAELSSKLNESLHGEKVAKTKNESLEFDLDQCKRRVDEMYLELRTKSSIVKKLNRCIKELSR